MLTAPRARARHRLRVLLKSFEKTVMTCPFWFSFLLFPCLLWTISCGTFKEKGISLIVDAEENRDESIQTTAASLGTSSFPLPSLSKTPADHLKDKDHNRDGKIDASEFGNGKQAFACLDLDHDGKIDLHKERNEVRKLFRASKRKGTVFLSFELRILLFWNFFFFGF